VPKLLELKAPERAIGQELLALMPNFLTDQKRLSSSKLAAQFPRRVHLMVEDYLLTELRLLKAITAEA
jgi:hypothetical protein